MEAISKYSKIAILLVSCLAIMSVLTISPSLPQMKSVFGHYANADFLVKLTLTIPALFIALSASVAGVIIDRFGRLKLLWIAILFYAVSGTAGFWLNDLYHLLISRAVLGTAAGIQMTTVTTLIGDYFEGKERQKFLGIQIAVMSLAGILFLSLGGVLADISWKYPFLIYASALLILPVAFFNLYEPAKISKQTINVSDVKSPRIIWFLFLNTMIMWAFFFLIPVQLPFYLKEIGVNSNALIGLAIALSTAFSAVSAFSYSSLKDRLNFFSIFALGYSLIAIGYLVLSAAENYLLISIGMILAGLGMGMMIPNTNMLIMKIAPIQIRGKEIGRLTTFWFMGQFLAPIVLFPLSVYLSTGRVFLFAGGALFLFSLIFLTLNSFITSVD